jgi:putative heme transporter
VIFKPLVGTLRHYRLKPALAACVVVLGLLALMTGVVVATVQGVMQQTDQINASVDAAMKEAVESSGVDQASLDAARAAIEQAAPMISEDFLTHLVSGVDKLIGPASGPMLAALITYYLPFFVIARSGIARLRSGGFFGQVADPAETTLQRMRE